VMDLVCEAGIRQVFMVAGGGAMHLDDAAGAHPGLEVVCTLHEQAAAIAAETYTKAFGRLSLCLVTTGPGGTNAITGVAGGWLDSTPMLIISGQVKRSDLVGDAQVRQRGVQEVDITSIVRPITKDAVVISDPLTIRYHVERAVHLATSGRPGPVWLDIPLDVQGASVDPDALPAYTSDEGQFRGSAALQDLEAAADDVVDRLVKAERPIVLLGRGLRLAGAEDKARRLVESLGIPVLATWPAQGIVGDDHPLYVGRPGPLAPRGANFALQNADLLIGLGTRLDLVTTGYDPADFGRSASKVVVDIDRMELAKLDGVVDRTVCADVGDFLTALLSRLDGVGLVGSDEWRAKCRRWRDRYPVVHESHRAPGARVSTYYLADVISDVLEPDDVLVLCSSGLGIEIFALALRLHTGQQATFTCGLGAMGYGPPAAIGACLGSGMRRTICVDGDGGLQLNVQELETIGRLHLPIKLFVLANDGYASIRASQDKWFGRLSGADSSSGVTLPDLGAVAAAYRIPYVRIDGRAPLSPQVRSVLDRSGPVLCEVPTPPEESREPLQVSEALPDGGMRSRPIEDLSPLLERSEFFENLPGRR